jgi:5-methylcytosine-specific restriction endonuclease McrA
VVCLKRSDNNTRMLLDSTTNTKKCSNSVCSETDPKAFDKNKSQVDGLANRCKRCAKESKISYRKKLLDKKLAERTRYLEENRDFLAQESLRKKVETNERVKKWHDQNREKVRIYKAKWQASNPKLRSVSEQRRRTRKLSLPIQWTIEDWDRCLAYFCHKCAYCGLQGKLHQDHFIPLVNPDCPGTVPWNIVPACVSCNCKKHKSVWPVTPLIESWMVAQKDNYVRG